jgi:hypothetical protein
MTAAPPTRLSQDRHRAAAAHGRPAAREGVAEAVRTLLYFLAFLGILMFASRSEGRPPIADDPTVSPTSAQRCSSLP